MDTGPTRTGFGISWIGWTERIFSRTELQRPLWQTQRTPRVRSVGSPNPRVQAQYRRSARKPIAVFYYGEMHTVRKFEGPAEMTVDANLSAQKPALYLMGSRYEVKNYLRKGPGRSNG